MPPPLLLLLPLSLSPRLPASSWLYPQSNYIELPPSPLLPKAFRPPRTPIWLSETTASLASLSERLCTRAARAAELAARRRAMPSLRQRDLRNEVVFGLVRYELEELANVVTDFFNTTLLIDYTSGRLNTSSIEEKAGGLIDRHQQRWPLVSWLLNFDYDPSLALLSEEERLQRRGRELREAVIRLWPAVVTKLKSAVRREPRLIFPVARRVVAASWLIAMYQIARTCRPLVSAKRIYELMNAFLVQVADLLRLTQMPDEERLVDFAVLEDAIATALAEPAIRLEVAVRRPQLLGLGRWPPRWPPVPPFKALRFPRIRLGFGLSAAHMGY